MSRNFLGGCLHRQSGLKSMKWLIVIPPKSFLSQFYSTTSPRLKAKNDTSRGKLKLPPTIATSQIASHITSKSPVSKISVISPSYQTYAMTLAQKSHQTLLYTAPSSSAYFISSYAAAGLCFGYGILSYWNNYLYAPPDIAVWIPYAFTGVSLATILFGIRFLRNPLRMIRNISAIPKKGTIHHTLEIEIELKKMFPLPYFPPRVISVAPNEIFIPTPLCRPIIPLSPSELRRQRAEENLRREQELAYERSHIMSAGVRHLWRAMSRLCTSIFRATQRAFTRENFVELRIRGKIYKLDLDGGWALDNGKAIDRLVILEPSSQSSLANKLT